MNSQSNRVSFLASILALFGRLAVPKLDSQLPQYQFLGQRKASTARLERRSIIASFGRRQGIKRIKALRREAKLAA